MSNDYDGRIFFPYTDNCKNAVHQKLEEHYSKEELPQVLNDIQEQYMKYLGLFNRDLGGKKNSRNGVGGTYDCIYLFCVYARCQKEMKLSELEDIINTMMLPSFQKLSFVDLNKPIYKKLFHSILKSACKKGNRFNDYHAEVEPYDKKKPIQYHFTSCPVAEFAKQFGFEHVLPYLCNVDFPTIACMKARLVRVHTLGNGPICDYAICGDQDPYLKEHEEYRDEEGYIRNK